jgi:hypothetical protein
VATLARDLGMRPGKRELCPCVALDRKGCLPKFDLRMTLIAFVVIGLRSKFSAVRIRMTRAAEELPSPISGRFAFGLMTF